MCTLLAVVPPPGGVLQVAANRDEFLARPASPPRLWPGVPAVLAPRDEQAGGTWLGVNAHRLFVGVTNRHGAARDSGRASRGQLVAEALLAESVAALHRRLAALGPRVYNPFHLFYADASGQAGLTVCDGTRLLQEKLGAGLHVLTESSFGAGEEGARVARARLALEKGGGQLALSAWGEVLREHSAPDSRQGACLHAPDFGYGTRSSFLLSLSPDCSADGCLWTEGPPCTSPFVDGSGLLRQVLGC
jgi:hypothetical protein